MAHRDAQLGYTRPLLALTQQAQLHAAATPSAGDADPVYTGAAALHSSSSSRDSSHRSEHGSHSCSSSAQSPAHRTHAAREPTIAPAAGSRFDQSNGAAQQQHRQQQKQQQQHPKLPQHSGPAAAAAAAASPEEASLMAVCSPAFLSPDTSGEQHIRLCSAG